MNYLQHWQKGKELNSGQYFVEKYLGGGGFGVTYQIKEKSTGNFFALKTLNEKQQDKPDFEQQQIKFINEAVALASCQHPHIVRVYPQMFKQDNLWCMVMEHIKGEDLAAYIAKKGILQESEGISLIGKVGDALSYIHQRGLLHRDIKPQNILLRQVNLSPVIIDFGLAREFTQQDKLHSMTNAITESFAPIEQYARKGSFGAWTDVYALAATLYVLLTAELPIPARFRQHAPLVSPQKLNPKISDKVNLAIIKGMEFAPENRPQSVKQWLELLVNESSILKLESNSIDNLNIQQERIIREEEPKVSFNPQQVAELLKLLSDNPSQANSGTQKDRNKESIDKSGESNNNFYNTQRASIYFERGNNSYSFKNYQEAIENYSISIQHDSQSDSVYYRRGNAYHKLKKYRQAISDYKIAVKINLRHTGAYRELGNAYYELQEYQKAIENYDRTIELAPQYNNAYQKRGNAYYQLQEYQRAIEDYNEAIEINPKNDYIYYSRANAYYQIKDYQEAIADCYVAIEISPKNSILYKKKIIQIYNTRANEYYKNREYSRSIQDYDEVIKLNPNNTKNYQKKLVLVYRDRANEYYQYKKYYKAIQDYNEAIKLDWQNANIYRQKIINCYDKLIEFDRDCVELYYKRAKINHTLQNYQNAIKDYERIIKLSPQSIDAYYKKAESLYLLDKIDAAIKDYGEVIRLDPHNLNAYHKRSLAYEKLGDLKKAKLELKKASKIKQGTYKKNFFSRIFN